MFYPSLLANLQDIFGVLGNYCGGIPYLFNIPGIKKGLFYLFFQDGSGGAKINE